MNKMRNDRYDRKDRSDERDRRDDRDRDKERERKTSSSSGVSPVKRLRTSSSLTFGIKESNTSRVSASSSKDKTSSSSSASSSANSSQYDVFKVTMDAMKSEEEKAIDNDPKVDLQLFKDTCDNIRQICNEIIHAKKEKDYEMIEALKVKGSLAFLQLKALNRYDKYRIRDARDKLQTGKVKVDTYHLQLQNMLYEVMHLQKECKTCETFRSKDEDIDLVPLSEFFESAPPDLARKDQDSHQLHLSRLQWELEQRKQLEEQLKSDELIKQKCEEEIIKNRETLEKLHPMLKAVVESTQPLHAQLQLPLQSTDAIHSSAEFLPRPLYVFYVQIVAYRHSCKENFDIKIIGNVEDAKLFNINLINDYDDDERDEPEDDDSGKTKKSRHRKSISVSNTKDTGIKKLIASHPLSVMVTLERDDSKLTCHFQYILRLEIVTVKVSVEQSNSGHDEVINETVLSKIFDGDSGLTSPNPANEYLIQSYGVDHFNCLINEIGYGFEWAQKLSGLEFMSTQKSDLSVSLSISWMHRIIKAIGDRFYSRISLQKQLKNFDNGIVTVPNELDLHTQISCNISEFKLLKKDVIFEHLHQNEQLQNALDIGIIDINDCFIYLVKLERSSAHLNAVIVVPFDYPNNPPFFQLTINWVSGVAVRNDSSLRELEENINCFCPKYIKNEFVHQLLSFQMYKLQLGFDIYLMSNKPKFGDTEGPHQHIDMENVKNAVNGRDHVNHYQLDTNFNVFMK